MEKLTIQLTTNRPQLSQNSIKTYLSLLKSLHSKCFPDKAIDPANFLKEDVILEYLKNTPYNKRKTTLSALVVLTNSAQYREIMMSDIAAHNATELEQTKNEKQDESMISFNEVKKTVKLYEKNAANLYREDELTMRQLQQIELYILLCLTSGIYIAPRRSADWIMKWRDYDTTTDNYYDQESGLFVFNNYKTEKLYGQQTVEVPEVLKRILKKWFLYNPTDYILFNEQYNPISAVNITQRLNAIFGKNISTSMLRHIYLTSKYNNINLKQIVSTAEQMGHSPLMGLMYVKRDKPLEQFA